MRIIATTDVYEAKIKYSHIIFEKKTNHCSRHPESGSSQQFQGQLHLSSEKRDVTSRKSHSNVFLSLKKKNADVLSKKVNFVVWKNEEKKSIRCEQSDLKNI